MRRVNCTWCGKVKVERVPWADGKRPVTKAFSWTLAGWARRLSWQESAQIFGVSWDRVRRSVSMAVDWGRARVDLSDVKTIGVTVSEIPCMRLASVAQREGSRPARPALFAAGLGAGDHRARAAR